MRASASRRLDACRAPVAQLAEATDLKSVCCGFESHRGYRTRLVDEAGGRTACMQRSWTAGFVARNATFPAERYLVRH